MNIEVYGIGELLVDMIKVSGGNILNGSKFEVHFGGAPANVMIGISRLGHKAGMIASVGNDAFGDFLISTLKENGVFTKFVIRKSTRTTLAFVTLSEKGERDFFFYRIADSMLRIDDLDLDKILRARIIHVSGFSMSREPTSSTVLKVMKKANKSGTIVSYDPNFRHDI